VAAKQFLTNNWQQFALIAIMYPTIALKLAEFKIPKDDWFDTVYLMWNAMLSAYSAWTVWMMWDAWVRVRNESAETSVIEHVEHVRSPPVRRYHILPAIHTHPLEDRRVWGHDVDSRSRPSSEL
jgi:hypothetical protein